MDNKENNIDELLDEYKQQKAKHEEEFEPLKPPVLSERQKQTAEKPKKEKKQKEKKKKREKKPINKSKIKKALKKILLVIVIICVSVGIVFGVIGIVNAAKTSYLKPYKAKYPDVDFPIGIQEKFCEYYGENPNTAGFIDIADLSYSEYILSDNNGINPVIDRANSRMELDFNTVVYLTSNLVDLEGKYSTKESYLSSDQRIKYSTLYDDYEFNIIGAFYTNKNPEDDMDYCFPYNLTQEMTDKSFDAYTDRLYHRFLYDTGYMITKDDKLITVCTKSDFMPNFRFIVVGVLNGEKMTAASNNDNVHYPQAWYDKNNKVNTYRFASKWYPEIYTKDGESTSCQSIEDFTKF